MFDNNNVDSMEKCIQKIEPSQNGLLDRLYTLHISISTI